MGHPQVLWEPVPVCHRSQRKMFIPYVQFKPTLFQFKTLAPSPVTGKKSLRAFLVSPLYIPQGHSKVSLEPSAFQAEHPQLSQRFCTGEVFQPWDSPLDPL